MFGEVNFLWLFLTFLVPIFSAPSSSFFFAARLQRNSETKKRGENPASSFSLLPSDVLRNVIGNWVELRTRKEINYDTHDRASHALVRHALSSYSHSTTCPSAIFLCSVGLNKKGDFTKRQRWFENSSSIAENMLACQPLHSVSKTTTHCWHWSGVAIL